MSEAIQKIKEEIEYYRQQEENHRIRRETLEQLLNKLLRNTRTNELVHSPTFQIHDDLKRLEAAKEITEVTTNIIANDGNCQFNDILNEVEKVMKLTGR